MNRPEKIYYKNDPLSPVGNDYGEGYNEAIDEMNFYINELLKPLEIFYDLEESVMESNWYRHSPKSEAMWNAIKEVVKNHRGGTHGA